MSINEYCAYNAGRPLSVPSDTVEFEHVAVTDGLAVVEYASMQSMIASGSFPKRTERPRLRDATPDTGDVWWSEPKRRG
jgi:hypothetical protein